MDLEIYSKKANGQINIPPSKSVSHRAIICACLAKGRSIIKNVNLCEDVKNTINILREFVPIKIDGTTLTIDGGMKSFGGGEFVINESATTLRMITPLLSYYSNSGVAIKTGEKLYKRGIKELEKLYKEKNKKITKKQRLFFVDKPPIDNEYNIDCGTSSQTASGMLIISPILGTKTKIILNGSASNSYIDLTIDIMKRFGIKISKNINELVIDNQEYKPTEFIVPSDQSFKLNIDVANALGSNIKTNKEDNVFIDPDASISKAINSGEILNKRTIDLINNPDAIFPLSILFVEKGKSVKFTNIARLQKKESNRVLEAKNIVESLGGKAIIEKNTIEILPSSSPSKQTIIIDSNNDHRIVFAGVLLSTTNKFKKVIVKNFDAYKKSVPDLLTLLDKTKIEYKTIEGEKINQKITNTEESIKITFTNNIEKEINKIVPKNRQRIIITDENTPKEFLKNQKESKIYFVRKAGEEAKELSEAERLYNYLLENNVEKSDYLIAYGGGTITDLVGFVASTYKRGIEHINIPTTLIAQVDASIGGKTGLNIEYAKNQIGTFKNPKETIINTDLLKSLPQKELKSGMAEIIKIAATSNPHLFYSIYDSKPYEYLNSWIKEAVKTKINIVSNDYFDEKERKTLNFGHTYGHAIELKQNITHGEAVAKGMMMVSSSKELENLLIKYGFETPTKKDQEEAKELLKQDKKIKNHKLTLIKLEKIGKTTTEIVELWSSMAKK